MSDIPSLERCSVVTWCARIAGHTGEHLPDAPRHGLPDTYPGNEPGFRAEQAHRARWVEFVGPTPQATAVFLQPGASYEVWPGGALFNEHGTFIGQLKPTCAPSRSQSGLTGT